MSETEDPRQLESIDANEISLVDSPAIRRKFLIVKRAEDEVARKKIDLDEEKGAADGAEKDSEEGPVAQDASQDPSIETDTASEEADADAVKADPAEVMEAAAALITWLTAQAEEADGELKGQLSMFLEALGVDAAAEGEAPAEGEEEAPPEEKAEDEPPAEEEEEEAEEEEKSDEGWESQLDAVNASMADVAKGADEEEEEEEEAEKSEDESAYVTTESFDAFATKMTQAITGIASSIQSVAKQSDEVSKRAAKLDSFTPVSKGADDHTPPADEVAKSEDVFGAGFFEARRKRRS